jgi:phosphohistidine swiveling domain-containing protein
LFPFTWPDAQAPAVHWQLYSIDQRRTEAIRPLEQDVRATFSGTFERAAVICGRPRYQRTWYVNGFEYTAEVENPRPEVDQALCREALEQTAAALAERGEAYNRTVWFPAIDAGNARLAVVDVDALALPDLAAHLEETLQWYERLWTWHWIWPQDGPARRFKQFYKQHFGQPVTGQVAASEQALDAEAQELLTYEPNLLTQAIDGLIELAGTIQQHEALRNLFETHAAASALEALPRTAGGDVLRAQLDRLLETQGLRCGAGFGTERNQLLPGWREQPALVLEMVQKYVPQDLTRLLQARLAATAERDRRAAALQARLPDESARAAFTFWLTAARRQQQAFEDHNYKIDSATSSLLHRAVAACARRLMTAGVLADPDDVWWLHAPDIALALRGLAGDASAESPEAGRAHWSALIAARKAQHAWRQQLTPPPVLGKLNSAPLAQAAPPTEAPAQPPNLLLNGEPGSTGVATGRVRLVSRDILVPDVVAGDVLVAHNAGPLWTPLFPVVAAVILDQGVLFQHAMLTCREYGVPAVFQTKDATQQLREGQRVTVDGTHGWVLAAEA